MEFEYKSSKNASTTLSPFEIDFGRIPLCQLTQKLIQFKVQFERTANTMELRQAFRIISRDCIAETRAKKSTTLTKEEEKLCLWKVT